ncbi:archease [Micromonospora sp. CPCC 205547]|uniref:archease n=1 Tax=Micromonospora sp. CPCC 205547 TaxID=3122400 RepID=UPI003B967CB2
MERRPGYGHRRVPHTADVRIEAWAPDQESCLAEAVDALVETFVDPDRLGQLQPGPLRRQQQRLHRLPGQVQRVARVVDRVVDQVAEVGAVRLAVVDDGRRAARPPRSRRNRRR